MATLVQRPPLPATEEQEQASAGIPWYIWCSVLAVTSSMIGVHWDISWHRSIGRDTFWTPAHLAIYLCGVLAGISCGYLILSTTFAAKGAARQAAVRIWGFRGPLGAFICAWGGIAMLASAPFDDWWHNAYGLDVKILSPPHVVLAMGIISIQLGGLILILGHMNRAAGAVRRRLEWLFLYVGGMIVVALLVVFAEHASRIFLHTGRMHRTVAILIPVVLAAVARASGKRWAATVVIGVYTAFVLGMLWILPLFPAEPKLGPVYQPVKQFIPMGFPLLLIVPALVLDWLWRRTRNWSRWAQSALSGAAFFLTFAAAQWPFSTFLMSPGARNWLFGSHYLDYATRPSSYNARHLFFPLEKTPVEFWVNMAAALCFAVLTMRLGLAWGEWMRRIRR